MRLQLRTDMPPPVYPRLKREDIDLEFGGTAVPRSLMTKDCRTRQG